MSDDTKELGDVKDSAKRAGDKISRKASELSDEAKELAGEAKEKASEFADTAKKTASEFAGDAKDVLSDGKNIAIIAHITLIGWIIALLMNSSNKTELGSFYIRQSLGLLLLLFFSWIPVVGWVLGIVAFIAWVMSLISALGGKMTPTFLFGKQFQEWFKAL